MNVLKIDNVSKKFGNKKVLDQVSLHIETNEITGVFGRNGSGKSTLLKCAYGVLDADDIKIQINGTPIKPKSIIPSAKIGYLPQEFFLPRYNSVRNLIQIYFSNNERLDNVFYAPGISQIASKFIYQLSYGQRRYLELILVSFLDHDFLFLDEPFSMIEPRYKELIQDFLIHLKAEKGIVITDHYYRDVLAISDKNILIKNAVAYTVYDRKDLVKYGYLKS